ncbi:hypothetical protein AB0I30_10170 [Nocardia tengchongensis]|uniref:hypothetical protein n=1 Tax=Nocardia tengchongensis TaxID=2055889 RepID=UPI0034087BA4
MSADDVRALLNVDRPAGWVQYQDGSWARIASDGWAGPPITTANLLGLIATVVDPEPLSVEVEY